MDYKTKSYKTMHELLQYSISVTKRYCSVFVVHYSYHTLFYVSQHEIPERIFMSHHATFNSFILL